MPKRKIQSTETAGSSTDSNQLKLPNSWKSSKPSGSKGAAGTSANPSSSNNNASKKNNQRKLLFSVKDEFNGDEDDDEDDEDDDEEEEDDVVEVKPGSKGAPGAKNKLPPPSIPPKEMYRFCKTLLDLEEANKINFTNRKAVAGFDALFKNVEALEGINMKEMQYSFRAYYRVGTQLRNSPMLDAIRRVKEHTEDEQSVMNHPDFPKRPQPAFQIYCHNFLNKEGKPLSTLDLKDEPEVIQNFKNAKDPKVVASRKKAEEERVDYLRELKAFLRDHSDSLFAKQIDFVNRKIKRLERDIGGPAKKRERDEPAKKRLSAFDFFMNSKKHKYPDMDPERREEKLMRHFDKLEADKREIFEELASNQ